ncbi:hypothetical protein CTEN210_11649 [Chaetoceros tenuissimus]|uniref:MYND-type domain-containing protein n=1 Tax=Chaetoceros tenuissimus TaxID=426638 RepID=A0AAD3H9Q9_9STRA|nr:hypothetical protein CTEN210_11649 [Chaetoceros tenuissimus]
MSKKKSRASKKKNRNGVAGKQASSDSANRGERAKSADFHQFQMHESLPLLCQKALQNAKNQSLGSKEQERLLKKMDAIYNKDVGEWVLTLYTMKGTGELSSLGSSLSIIFDKLVFLVKNAISATKEKDVLIDGLNLYMVVYLMCSLMKIMNTDEVEVLNLLKFLTNTMKAVSGTHYSSSGAAYVLCDFMMYCLLIVNDKKGDEAKSLLMIARTGILEQVLLHIHLSWSPSVEGQALVNQSLLQKFFGLLNSYSSVVHKIFKEGTACHNALDAIVHGRIHPCKENEHLMELLRSLKKISDLSTCKPFEKESCRDKTVIDMASQTCAKCNIVDLERPLLVCAKCKSVGYCSKECQVTDWKKHKVECDNINDMNAPVNMTKHTCVKCHQVDLDKQLLVCAKCKYAAYCSKECQVSHWKDHKLHCDFFRNIYRNIDEITHNFYHEHCDLIHDKVEAARLKTGLDFMELALDLNFTSSLGEVAPALRSPPEFEVLPASIFWNREKDKEVEKHHRIIALCTEEEHQLFQEQEDQPHIYGQFIFTTAKPIIHSLYFVDQIATAMSLRGTSSRIKTSSHRVHREIIEQEEDVVELTTNSSEEVLVPSLPSIPLPSLPLVPIPSSNENCTDSSEWTDSDGNGCYLYNQETFNCTESGADEHCCFSCTNKMGQWQLPWELPTVISTEPRPPPPLNQPPLIPSLPGFGDPTLQELPGDDGMNQPPLMPPMMPSFGLPSVPIPSSDENCTDSSEWTDSDGNDCSFYQRDEFNCTESGADEHCCLSCSSMKIGQNQLPWEIGILVTDPDPSPGDGGINQEISSQPSSQGSSQEDRTYDTNFIIKFLPSASIMTLAIIQTILSLLSLIASIAVICMIARSHAKLSTVFHRLLLGLCIADIVLSLSLAFLTAPIPAKYSQDIWNAQGTIDTHVQHKASLYLLDI